MSEGKAAERKAVTINLAPATYALYEKAAYLSGLTMSDVVNVVMALHVASGLFQEKAK